MSIVRLELSVPDGIAAETANKLAAIYGGFPPFWPDGCTGCMVEVLADEEIQRERVLLRAAGYLMPERWQQRHIRDC
jgi:hypothetical protein